MTKILIKPAFRTKYGRRRRPKVALPPADTRGQKDKETQSNKNDSTAYNEEAKQSTPAPSSTKNSIRTAMALDTRCISSDDVCNGPKIVHSIGQFVNALSQRGATPDLLVSTSKQGGIQVHHNASISLKYLSYPLTAVKEQPCPAELWASTSWGLFSSLGKCSELIVDLMLE